MARVKVSQLCAECVLWYLDQDPHLEQIDVKLITTHKATTSNAVNDRMAGRIAAVIGVCH